METEEDCKMEETLNNDTSSITPLDTGSTFNSTSNGNTLIKMVKTKLLIALKTNF